ncbi:metallophosphoesterase family protein [Aquirufa sp. Wall-65K1]
MKKILIISDTHSFLDPRLEPHLQACDQIWHAGDWGSVQLADQLLTYKKPIAGVYGNIDDRTIRNMYPKIMRFRCEEVNIAMTHIAGAPSSYKPDAYEAFSKGIPQIFVCGHSHILQVKRDIKRNNMLFINPGAAGQHGFHPIQTAIQLKIDGTRIYDVEIIQMERNRKVPKEMLEEGM